MRGQLRGAGLAGSPDRVSRPSDAAAPYRLTRHIAAGNAVTEPSTARRPNSLPLIGAEPLAGGVGVCSAGPHSRFSATSLELAGTRRCRRWLLGVRHETWAPSLRSTAVFLVAVSGEEPLLPFAGPAVVVAVHPPLIRTVATRDAVGMIAPQRRTVAVRFAPGSPHPRRRRRTCWRHAAGAGLAHHAVAVAVAHERIRRMVARYRSDPVRSSFRATDAAVPVVVPRGDLAGNAGCGGGGRNLATRERDQLRRRASCQYPGPARPPRVGQWSARGAPGR